MFDKELIYVDERLNVTYMVYNGSFLKIFPIADHPSDKWMSPEDFGKSQFDSREVISLFTSYLDNLNSSIKSKNYASASSALAKVKAYQYKYGADLIPSAAKTKIEVFYNNINIFKSLFPVFMLEILNLLPHAL